MTLCAEDKQAACFANLVCLFLDFVFILFLKLDKCLSRVEDFLIVCFGKTCCLVDKLICEFHLLHLSFCKKFCVTAEHNIGTTACHVCCDCYCAVFTCLSNDFSLFFVLFGVEHIVLDATLFKHF